MNENDLAIREAGPGDIPTLARIIRDSFRDVAARFALTPENCPKHPSNCTEQWIAADLARGVHYYVLLQAGRPVGCVALERASSELCYLERLAVLPEMRLKGLGGRLVRHALARAASAGARRISIGIIAEQAELGAWYMKFGFADGQTRQFPHLPFRVRLLERAL